MCRSKRWRALLAAVMMALAVTTTQLTGVQPAGAAIVSNTDWHQGRLMTEYWGSGVPGCTSGPHFYSYANGNYYMAMPRHCFQVSCPQLGWNYGSPGAPYNDDRFMSNYEAAMSNYFDHNEFAFITNSAYPVCTDVVMVKLGHSSNASARQRASNNVFNYCNPNQLWNCSSFNGGGYAVNGPWQGSWKTVTGASTYADFTGWGSVCKTGQKSGTSCGNVTGRYQVSDPNGFVTWVNIMDNLGQCGVAGGDSGGPVHHEPNGSWNVATNVNITSMGMAVVAPNLIVAGPGNSCYSEGTRYSTSVGFISNGDLMNAFNTLQLSPVIWNP